MKLDSLARKLRTAGFWVVAVSVTRAVTLMQVFNSWAQATASFWNEDWTVGETSCVSEVVNAVCFSRVTAELVRGRVLSLYYDQCDSLPTLIGVILGVSMLVLAKLIVQKKRT